MRHQFSGSCKHFFAKLISFSSFKIYLQKTFASYWWDRRQLLYRQTVDMMAVPSLMTTISCLTGHTLASRGLRQRDLHTDRS